MVLSSPPPVAGDAVPPVSDGTRRPRRTRWADRARALRGSGGLRILGAAVGGYAVNDAFAPSTRWWLAPLGLALFGLVTWGRRLGPGLGLGLVFGLFFYVPLLSWTGVYVGPISYALSIAEALLTALVGGALAVASRLHLSRRVLDPVGPLTPGPLRAWLYPVLAAALWVAGETLRGRFPFGGFPWAGLAFTQADGPLLPSASLLGSAGLAFLTALAGFALTVPLVAASALFGPGVDRSAAWCLLRRRVVAGSVLLVLVGSVGLAGRLTMVDAAEIAAAPQDVIAVVQGNVPEPGLDFNATRRQVTSMHAERTHELAAAVRAGTSPAPRLVLWPENSSDIDPYRDPIAAEMISSAARDIGVPILVGAVVQNGTKATDGFYNRGIVWDPVTGPGAFYDKRHPVPFAEYMPYRSFFRIFSAWVDRAGYFLPGDRPGNLDVAGVPVGDVICFEVVYDDLVRDVVDGGAQVLVVQTNNATFGYTDETYQQQAMSRIRAVEHGREVLVVATSGVSAVIRPDGSVESTIGLFTPGYLTPTVPLLTRTTPGTVLGNGVEWSLTVSAAVVLLLGFAMARSAARPAGRTPSSARKQSTGDRTTSAVTTTDAARTTKEQ
ncbi:apolipoprotein N-acyltransferase [Nakamurella flava]|uniref:Apolipoprotein N-acyltransferase n=1 Tax=Nakamurella flava TaxID=2576308 RepID=A0A4U6QL51_9ACTN|nr:apolipoprotein N-acyltransferase [Nakamurella flava]TKV60886.1 apolipoprotein N-acyltransferase [Nakamurella flava]